MNELSLRQSHIEDSRDFWAGIARTHGWYTEPFHVQVWFNPDGTVHDSVSTRALTQDIIIDLTEEEIQDLESDD